MRASLCKLFADSMKGAKGGFERWARQHVKHNNGIAIA
jgi:hypothetical protein